MAKRRRKIKAGRIILLAVLAAVLVFGIITIRYRNNLKPAQKESQEVLFTVQPGDTLRSVGSRLEEEGIIRDAGAFYRFGKSAGLTDLKAGDYIIDPSTDPETILKILTDSSQALTDEVNVTIVEGDWAKHAASKIAARTTVPAEDLLRLWNDENYIRSLMGRYPFLTDEIFNDQIRIKLEGYLAPETYRFFRETTAEAVTEKMLDQSLAVFNEYKDDILASGLSIHELYTLASIVQYEAGKPEDMKMIAGVFYNRLNTGMLLQSSVTVCYSIDIEQDDNWWACEVNSDYESPYNTYKYAGLPPGPIENPGRDAFEAVLHPTPSNYLYFMADVKTGTVYYAETLEEHNANVRKYLN